MKRGVDAYLFNGKIFIATRKKTAMGLELFAGGVKTLSHTDDATAIGVAVRAGLEQFAFNQPHPSKDEMKNRLQPLVDAAGVKTSNAFFSKVKSVPISQEDGKITFYPTINRGVKDGFAKTTASNIELPESAGESEIGAALLKAFDSSSVA